MGYSPWGRKESDTTGRLHFDFSLSRIEKGNGNPLQYSCLENPRDGRALWAISGLLCTPGRQESNANVRRLCMEKSGLWRRRKEAQTLALPLTQCMI